MVLKAVKWGIKPISTAYNTLKKKRALSMEQIAGLLFPILFGLVYIFVLGGCVWFLRESCVESVWIGFITLFNGDWR